MKFVPSVPRIILYCEERTCSSGKNRKHVGLCFNEDRKILLSVEGIIRFIFKVLYCSTEMDKTQMNYGNRFSML